MIGTIVLWTRDCYKPRVFLQFARNEEQQHSQCVFSILFVFTDESNKV